MPPLFHQSSPRNPPAGKEAEVAAKADERTPLLLERTGVGDPEEGVDGAARPSLEWESRGTVLGLMIDIGGTHGYHALLLLALWYAVEDSRSSLPICTLDKVSGLRSQFGVCVCEYTKAFVVGFPALTVTAWLLLLGRDLLSKRFYYGLLRSGGVLEFGQKQPWKDPLVLAVVTGYLHMVWHLCLMFLRLVPSSAAVEAGGQVDPALLKLNRMHLVISSIAAPSTLLVVFFYLAYDMEKSLVPLSEYVHAAEDARDSLRNLHVIRDAAALQLLGEAGDIIADGELDIDQKYAAFLERHKIGSTNSGHLRDRELADVGLMQSLWPAQLLMRRFEGTSGSAARRFRSLFNGFALGALICFAIVLRSLVKYALDDVTIGMEGQYPRLLSLAVVAWHLVVVGCGAMALARAIGLPC